MRETRTVEIMGGGFRRRTLEEVVERVKESLGEVLGRQVLLFLFLLMTSGNHFGFPHKSNFTDRVYRDSKISVDGFCGPFKFCTRFNFWLE